MSSDLDLIANPATRLDDAYALCERAIANDLFTAMRFHAEEMEVERLYSSLPEIYPVSGRKPKRHNEWGEKVLIRREINVGFGPDDITWAFSDFAIILGLGLEAVLNIPVATDDRVLGTINFLRKSSAFTQEEIGIGRQLANALSRRKTLS